MEWVYNLAIVFHFVLAQSCWFSLTHLISQYIFLFCKHWSFPMILNDLISCSLLHLMWMVGSFIPRDWPEDIIIMHQKSMLITNEYWSGTRLFRICILAWANTISRPHVLRSISSLLKITPPNIMQFGKGWVGLGSGGVVNCTCTSRRQKPLMISFILSRSSIGIQLLPRRERSSTRFEEARHTIMKAMSCYMGLEIFHLVPRVKGMYL